MNRKHKGQPGIPNAVAAFVQHAMFHLIFVMLVLFLPRVDSKVVEVAIRKCVPGTPCTAQVSSSSYTADVPHLMVVREDHPCGAPPDSQFKAAENPVGGTAAVGNTSFFDFGIAGPSPGLFRLCLCTMNCKPSQLVNPLAFNEDVGDLVISGPLEAKQMPAFCIAGGPPCTVNITAIGAHPGDMLSVLPSGSNCSSSPFAIVSRQNIPKNHVVTTHGIGTGSIEFFLDKDAISQSRLPLALTETFSNYFDMDSHNNKDAHFLSGIFFTEISLGEQSMPPNVWEFSYEVLHGFDKVRAMKSLVATWTLPMDFSNASFQYVLQSSIALLARNVSLTDDLVISNFTQMAIQPLTTNEAEVYLDMKQGNVSIRGRSLGMLQGSSWRRLSAEDEQVLENSSSDDSEAVPIELNLTDDSDADPDAHNQTSIDNDTADLVEITLRLRSPSISYYDLIKAPQLTAKLIAAVQHRFADLSGTTSKNVHVTLAPGSLLIFVTIVVPDNAALQIRSKIIDQVDDGTVGDTLAIDISSIPGISSVSFGPITINTEVIDGHTLDSTAANTTLSTLAKRAPLLTSYLAFELNLFGGNWLLCYTYSGVSGDSSMKVGDLPIFGAGLLRSVGQRPRVGHPFVLEVYAPLGGLLLEDRLMITDAEAPMCGAALPTENFEGVLGLPNVGSTGNANTSLQWENLSIKQAGVYTGCWCWSGRGECSTISPGNDINYTSELFSLELNNFTVHGPLGFQPARVAAGDSFNLLLSGIELSSLDVIRFVNGSVCGGPSALVAENGGDFEGSQGDESLRVWPNLTFFEFGSYTVCWCYMSDSGSKNCSNDEEADFSVGTLEVWGPVIAEHRCTMSSLCAIGIYGVPSQEPSSILLRSGQALCENSNAPVVDVPGLINPQRSQAARAGFYNRLRFSPVRARSGRTIQLAELVFYFNRSQVDMHGASTRRLQDGRGPISEGPEFAVDKRRSTKFLDFDGVGFEISLAVPARIDAVSYITANDSPERDPTSFLLEGFTDKWHVLAAPERLAPPLARFTETESIPCVVGVPGDETVAQTVYSLGVPIGTSPGLSTICWQHNDDAVFAVQAGNLEFAGLISHQTQKTQKCFLGQRCTFGPMTGYSLSSADRVVAIPAAEHCSQGFGPISTAAVSSRPSWAGPWMVSLSELDGFQAVTVDWMPGAIYSGNWKLCYCVHTDLGCTAAASYTIEMGLLAVVGPFSLGGQNFSCSIHSPTCSIGPLTGQGISGADLILLAPAGEACGNLSTALPDAIGMSDLAGLVLEATTVTQRTQAAETLTFTLDNASARTQVPGSWVICYCVADGNRSDHCSDEAAFSALVGHLVIVGPEPKPYHCTLGLPCHVKLAGHGLHISNAIMVIDSSNRCGSASALPFEEHDGVTWPQRARGQVGEFYAGIPTSGPVGSVGRLCWAVGWSHWQDFAVEVGAFEMFGPQQGRNFTCTFGIPCSLNVLGHGLSLSSEVWIIGGERLVSATWEANALDRSCAVAAQSDEAQIDGFANPLAPQQVSDSQAAYNPGVARGGQVGPFFRICWRHSQVTTFAVEVGRFALQGPQATSGFCVKGYPCNVTLGGFGLNSRNTLRVIDENCTNGTDQSVENATDDAGSDTSDGLADILPMQFYPDATGLLGTTEPLKPRDGTDNIYDLGTVTRGLPGTKLFLCWSGELAGELTPIGFVQLAGPHDDQDLACDSGRPCEPNILGFASPLWREYWLVTGTGQYLPNFSIFLSTKCEPVWGRHGGDLTHTWERIPGAEKGVVYFVSGKLQACPNYALHLHPVDCSVVATQWEGNDMSKSWIELSNGASSPEYWILTPSNAPCPSKMLTAEAGTLRGTDFFRSPLTQWKIPGRDASPWPHRSSFLLLPQGSGCNASTAIEKEGLSNPSQCCDRAREQELQLMVSFGSFGTGSGRYDVCWGRTFGDGLNGGADSPLPASSFPIFVGVLSLLAPESLGVVQCTLGLPCFVTLYGLGLSALDSVVVHAGSSCEWPDLPPFDMEGAPDCSITGSDSYLKAELVANQRLIVSTTCPRGGYEEFGMAKPKALLRSYSFPRVAQVMEYSFLPLPNGIAGVALDGLAISGAPASKTLWEQSQCGLVIKQAMAEYALTPGGRWSDGPCEVVKSWALDFGIFGALNSSHEPMLGFMMDGVPLFAPLSNLSNFSLDSCGGHTDDLPFYHYHAADSFDSYSGKLLGCLRAAASGGNGFAVPPPRISWPPMSPQHFFELDNLMARASLNYGLEEVLLTNARTAARFLPQSLDNSSEAVYSIQRPAEVLNYSVCWGRGLTLDEHQVYLGSLIYIGPFQKDYLCILTQECILQIEGAGLSIQSSLFISNDTCELPIFLSLNGLSQMPAQPVLGAGNFSLYNLGAIQMAVVGPSFTKICWSDFPGNIVEVGTLEFLGPARLDQNFTCSPGQTCNLRVEEYALSTSPSLLRAGTSCAQTIMEGRRISAVTLQVTRKEFSWTMDYSFGIIPADADPGHFMLCWYPISPERLAEGFPGSPISSGIPVGMLTLRGPTELQVHPPAVAGMFFRLQLFGVVLLDTDEIRILDNSSACGSDSASNNSQYVSFGSSLAREVRDILIDHEEPNSSTDTSDGLRESEHDSSTESSTSSPNLVDPDDAAPENSTDFSDGLIEDPEDSDGGVQVRGRVAMSVGVWENVTIQVGGVFKVCWCPGHHACKEDADFAVNAGSIVVRGALPLSQTEMAAGTPFLLQIDGLMLSTFDRMHIIPSGVGLQCFKAHERPYQHEAGVQLELTVSEDGTEAWANATIMTAGLYEACFCPGTVDRLDPCKDFSHIGDLIVLPTA